MYAGPARCFWAPVPQLQQGGNTPCKTRHEDRGGRHIEALPSLCSPHLEAIGARRRGRLGVLVFGVGGSQQGESLNLCFSDQQSVGPQSLPLNKTMGGRAGLWPEGRANRPLRPAERKNEERESVCVFCLCSYVVACLCLCVCVYVPGIQHCPHFAASYIHDIEYVFCDAEITRIQAPSQRLR